MEQYIVKVLTNDPAQALLALRQADKLWQAAWDEDGLIVNAPVPYFDSVNHLMFSVDNFLERNGVSGRSQPVSVVQ